MSRETKIMLGICAGVAALMIGAFAIFNRSEPTTQVADAGKLVREDSYTTGEGKVEVVEFADFQCPACAQAAPQLLRLKSELKDKVKVVFRHFPLPSHRHAEIAAQAAEAAGEQGKFWEMYELIYKNQTQWSGSGTPLKLFKDYAKELNLDVDKFAEAVTSRKFQSKIDRDLADATALGVNATPTVYVAGQKLTQFPSFDTLKAAVEKSSQ